VRTSRGRLHFFRRGSCCFVSALPLFALLSALLPALVWSEDWPVWTGPHGRNFSSEHGLPVNFSDQSRENIAWTTKLGAVVFGAPTVAKGRIFVGTNIKAVRADERFSTIQGGVLACLEESSGEVLWTLVSPERTRGFPPNTHMIHQRWGICSSPAVKDNRVYVITNGDDVLCLDVLGLADGNDGPFREEARYMSGEEAPTILLKNSDADIVWRYDIPRALSVAPHDVASCSPLIHENVLYASTSNGIGKNSPVYALKRDAPAFIALDARTGTLLATEGEGISQRLFHAQWSSPSKGKVNGKTLVFLGGGDGVCYAFEALKPIPAPKAIPKGVYHAPNAPGALKLVWRYDCNPIHYRFRNGKPVYFYQGDVRVYRNKQKANVDTTNFNSGDGSFLGPNQIIATPVFYKNRLFVITGRDPEHGLGRGALHCIDATQNGDITGTGRLWIYEAVGRSLSTIAVADDLLYAVDLSGRLHCLDVDTGRLYWIHDTQEESWGAPLVADNKVYLNTKKSFWILAVGKQKKVLFRQSGGSECGPIAANGVLYTFRKGQLHALRQESVREQN
jgi:outer membrane protein assembly factor BamB